MNRKFRTRPLFKVLMIWIAVEIAFQVYFQTVVMNSYQQQWEKYAIDRNMNTLLSMEHLLLNSPARRIYFEYPPELSPMDSIDPSLRSLLLKLRMDLAMGICTAESSYFAFGYWREENGMYQIDIEAGPKFSNEFRGYNLSLVITNGGNPAHQHVPYQDVYQGRYFVNPQINRQNKSSHWPFRYNNEMYHLLTFRLLKRVMEYI